MVDCDVVCTWFLVVFSPCVHVVELDAKIERTKKSQAPPGEPVMRGDTDDRTVGRREPDGRNRRGEKQTCCALVAGTLAITELSSRFNFNFTIRPSFAVN